MVWGMNLPSDFGQFWPDGGFEGGTGSSDGWWHRLTTHYLAQSQEEQRRLFGNGTGLDASRYSSHVWRKFTHERGTKGTPEDPPFTSIEPHEPPQSFVTEKTYRTLGSLIIFNAGIIAVDEPLKAIFERLEPGVHSFYPIDIVMPKGAVFSKQYYTLVIGKWFDSFLPDKSGPTSKNRRNYTYARSVFGGAHLWRDRRTPAITCFSDELNAAIEAADLKLPKLQKMREV